MNAFRTPFPLINAVLLNLQDGTVFVDDEKEVFFIFHKAEFSYLNTKRNYDYEKVFAFITHSDAIPAYFHIYDAPAELLKICESDGETVNVKVRNRIQLKFNRNKLQPKYHLLGDYSINKISSSNFNLFQTFNLFPENKFWRSKQDFLENGFGFFVIDHAGNPVSICYTACVVNETAEIDVATLPEYQKKGLAKAVVGKFVSFCLENNITANWDCFEENKASLKTAESLGFEPTLKYSFLSIFNKKRKNENS